MRSLIKQWSPNEILERHPLCVASTQLFLHQTCPAPTCLRRRSKPWQTSHATEKEQIYLRNAFILTISASPDPIWRSKLPTGFIKDELWSLCGPGEDADQKLRPNVGQDGVKSDKTDGGGCQKVKWVSSQWGGKGKQMDKIRSLKWNISSCKSSAWGQKSGCPCSSSLKCIAFEFSRCVNYTQQTRAKGHCWREHSL